MIEAKLRDVSIKGRRFRNLGMAIGTIKRLNGNIIPLALLSRQIDKHLVDTNNNLELLLNLEGEEIKSRIISTAKHVLLHNTINIDFVEIE